MVASEEASEKRARRTGPRRQFPVHSLEQAMVIGKAIADRNAGRPMDRVLLAKAIGRTPASSEFFTLLSSSYRYGLTDGTEKSPAISLNPLGLRIFKPNGQADKKAAVREAVLVPDLFRRVLQHYNQGKLPQGEFFRNALERQFGIPGIYTDEFARILVSNATLAGLVEEINGNLYVRFDAFGELTEETTQEAESDEVGAEAGDVPVLVENSRSSSSLVASAPVVSPSSPRQIFIAHGKNRQPLEELRRVLDRFKVPFKVAVDEPNAGRPISQKVADIMKSCSAAIFIFTKDEEFNTTTGETIWRPSENVVFELGAAAYLYGTKIIIFKEEGVKFASDFQDLGYITFKPGSISSNAPELLTELIALNFIRLEVT